MIEHDTIKLLRECDAGIKMGVSAISDVLEYVKDPSLQASLSKCKEEHNRLGNKIQAQLSDYHDDGKDPNPIAKSMSWIKTNAKLVINESDQTIADLITDGCNMGVKSLSRYLNQYQAASESSKDIAKHLIQLERTLAVDISRFL